MNRFLLCFWFAVALPGCGGITSAPTDALPQAARRAAAHVREASRDLLYASEAANTIRVYTYPQGAQVATITAVAHPGSECSDTSGNVFVRDWATRNLYEFAHGGTTPIQTLSPAGVCAVDPTTNDLAVLQGNSVLISRTKPGRQSSTPTRALAALFFGARMTATVTCFFCPILSARMH